MEDELLIVISPTYFQQDWKKMNWIDLKSNLIIVIIKIIIIINK